MGVNEMIIHRDEAAEERVNEKMTRKILNHSSDLMIVEVHFQQGGVGEPHSHSEYQQMSYVVSGRFEVVLGEEKRILAAGDTFYADKNVRHGVKALEDSVLLDIFTPRRVDFLNK
jgi:quercetin dioxygenase-like cupin family protein